MTPVFPPWIICLLGVNASAAARWSQRCETKWAKAWWERRLSSLSYRVPQCVPSLYSQLQIRTTWRTSTTGSTVRRRSTRSGHQGSPTTPAVWRTVWRSTTPDTRPASGTIFIAQSSLPVSSASLFYVRHIYHIVRPWRQQLSDNRD